jgi:hypothetical protein
MFSRLHVAAGAALLGMLLGIGGCKKSATSAGPQLPTEMKTLPGDPKVGGGGGGKQDDKKVQPQAAQ